MDEAYTDHKPTLGSGNRVPPYLLTFVEWTRTRGLETIGLSLIKLLNPETTSAMLGGLLRFISYRDTLHLLRQWALEHTFLRQLSILSEHLIDFPEIELPLTSQPIHLQFAGQMERNYLPVQFSTRRAPGLTAREQLQITCLRAWILLKAVEFAKAGHPRDRCIRHLCTQLRMALDDRDSGKKLAWFLSVAEPALTLQQFELTLKSNIDQKNEAKTGIAATTISSIQALLNNHPHPEPSLMPDWRSWSLFEANKDIDAAELSLLEMQTGDTMYWPADEEEDEPPFREDNVSENATPPQIARESRGIVFQTQEDQQYLPFSWNRLRTDELTALKCALHAQLLAPSATNRLLATATVIALVTRMSLETIESIPLSVIRCEEWRLDPIAGRLHRLPSRRAVRWRANDRTKEWIRPLSNEWEWELHESLSAVIQSVGLLHPEAQRFGQLWVGQDLSMASAFNKFCANLPELARVSSGLLVRQSEQIAFEQTLDSTFARLVTSPSRAGIPGAGAYPSWSHGQVAKAINQISESFGAMTVVDSLRNGLGSELDPDDGLLTLAMTQMRHQLNTLASQPDAWLSYHNHMVAYGVLMLLAATGARPVNSVFESTRQFDLAHRQIYLEDKVGRTGLDGTTGRLVPLVSSVSDFLANVYYPYLRHLASGMRRWIPALADELERQVNGNGSDALPLFFLLRQRPEFDWLEVNESSLCSLGLIAWPLPLNLFRHRLATRLRTLGTDPELIDAQFGHAEAGSETFGDISPRSWEAEEPAWRHALEQAFNQLEILPPVLAWLPINPIQLAPGYQPIPDQSFFGREARRRERARRKDTAAKNALEEIQAFVKDRPVDSIPGKDWELLGRQMLLTKHNLRQPNSAVRYQVYEDYLQREWKDKGHRPRLRKWLTRLPQPQSAFRADVIGVTARLDAVRDALDAVHAQLTFPIAKNLAALLATLDLCAFGGVSSLEVLRALAYSDTDKVRLVLFERQAYIEYSKILTKMESAPVLRYALPSRSVKLADHALSAGKSLGAFKELPPILGSIGQAARLSGVPDLQTEDLLNFLALNMEQENARRLPGTITAVLAARLTSYALPWKDWIRVRSGQARHPTSDEREVKDPLGDAERELVVINRSPIGMVPASDRERCKVANRHFLGQIRAALSRYLSRRLASDGDSVEGTARHRRTNTDSSARRNARNSIQNILKKPVPAISVAVHALGSWTLHLLTRPYRKGLLDAASIKRYLDTLAHGFVSFGHELDLADMDGDELTEFYRSVVEDGASFPDGDKDQAHETLTDKTTGRNETYVLQRLVEFHQFAQTRYGLDAPDWSEIGEGLLGSAAHPGSLTEAEYLHAVHTLCPQPLGNQSSKVRDAFILLLAYRFGLRGGEAIGLRRSEWVEVAGSIVLLVSSRHRQLKTRCSQRQVPLLEPLTEHEKMIVQRWLAHWTTETGEEPSTPLFFDEALRHHPADMRNIRPRLIAALRAATLNQQTTLHHTRHAYANRMGLHLIARAPPALWPAHQTSDSVQTEAIQRATLLTVRKSRRAPWAVARLLGHASPRTTFCSYLHLQLDWAAQHVQELSPSRFMPVPQQKFKRVVDLDLWPIVGNYLSHASISSSPQSQPCTPSRILKFCRLRAQGMPARSAGEHCQFASKDWHQIEDALVLAGRKLAPSVIARSSDVADIALPQVLLGRIQKHRWTALIDHVEKREQTESILPPFQGDAECAQQIGTTRQLLLWTETHFIQLRQFMDWMQMTDDDISIFRPSKLDPLLIKWAIGCGFTNLKNARSASGRKSFQIDVASEMRAGAPAIVHPDRLAAVTTAANRIAMDNYELLLLWLSASISQSPGHVTSAADAAEQ